MLPSAARRAARALLPRATRAASTMRPLSRSPLVASSASLPIGRVVGGPFAARAGALRSMFIQTEPTPNPQSLKFLPGREVLDERFSTGVDFTPGSDEVRRSGLAKKLFQIDGVTRVFFGKDFISVTKREDEDWDVSRRNVVYGGAVLSNPWRAFYFLE
jgi:NFU1 iron-sulfur cluster scaffold homolog, mitochondrial